MSSGYCAKICFLHMLREGQNIGFKTTFHVNPNHVNLDSFAQAASWVTVRKAFELLYTARLRGYSLCQRLLP